MDFLATSEQPVEARATLWQVVTALLSDPTVSEITFNGWDKILYRTQGVWQPYTGALFRSELDYEQSFLDVFAPTIKWTRPLVENEQDSTVTYAKGAVEGTLHYEGLKCRVVVVFPPTARQLSITITRPSLALSLDEIAQRGTMSSEMLSFIRGVLASDIPMIVSGSTGAGKTTLMNAIIREWGEDRRIVLIEDVEELILNQSNGVAMLSEAAYPGVAVDDQVSLGYLIGTVVRIRGDRLVIGEVRDSSSAEAGLLAINLGISSALLSLHASSEQLAFDRLRNLVVGRGRLSEDNVARMFATISPIIIHMRKIGDQHVVSAIAETAQALNVSGQPNIVTLFKYAGRRDGQNWFTWTQPLSDSLRTRLGEKATSRIGSFQSGKESPALRKF